MTPITGKFFPSQGKEEKVFLLLRRHWFTYLIFLAIALIMSVPLFVLIGFWFAYPDSFIGPFGNVALLGASAYSLIILGLMLYGFVNYYLDVYIVTNERLVNIEQDGFFRRGISELHLHQVQDVSAKVTGIMPTLVHYGDIFVQTAGERENFIFKSIPNPYRVSKKIIDLHEAQLEEPHGQFENSDKSMSAPEELVGSQGEYMGDFSNQVALKKFTAKNPKSFSLARKRTKDFLRGRELIETDIDDKISQEIKNQKEEKILQNISNNTDDYTNPLQNNSHQSPEIAQNTNQSTKEPTPNSEPEKKQKSSSESEHLMKENQEIDIE